MASKRAGNDVVVVVSAMGKTTDQLLALAHQVDSSPPRRELDMLVSTGERVSMALLSMAIQKHGVDAISFTGSQSGIITNDRHFDARIIEDLDASLVIDGQGGPITVQPLRQQHGSITSLGYRFGDFAYCCDVSDFPRETIGKLEGLEHIVIDSLQYKPHPSHLSIDQALWWIEKLGAHNAILTHMHIPLDYETVRNETPPHVEPAYDGLTIEYEVEI